MSNLSLTTSEQDRLVEDLERAEKRIRELEAERRELYMHFFGQHEDRELVDFVLGGLKLPAVIEVLGDE